MPPRRARGQTLRPAFANAGIEAAYRRSMYLLIAEMHRSYVYWLKAQYRETPPRTLAEDAASPAEELERELKKLGRRWQKKFDEAAPRLAKHFARSVDKQSKSHLRTILREGGWSVKMQPFSPELQDVMNATVAENVGLIKSISSQYHTQVQGLVMRSVTEGRRLDELTKELQKRYGVTRRRAELIALDQNNKATSVINRERQLKVGIQKGVWMHSHAGKEPRRTHLANDGKEFDLQEGWFDPDPKVRKKIWPGQLIRCRCTWKPVVKGFS